jgi:hypothetical protein
MLVIIEIAAMTTAAMAIQFDLCAAVSALRVSASCSAFLLTPNLGRRPTIPKSPKSLIRIA